MDGRLRTNAAECQYKEYNRLLTKEFISGLIDDGMIDEILKGVAVLEDISDVTCEHVLFWALRIEEQRAKIHIK